VAPPPSEPPAWAFELIAGGQERDAALARWFAFLNDAVRSFVAPVDHLVARDDVSGER